MTNIEVEERDPGMGRSLQLKSNPNRKKLNPFADPWRMEQSAEMGTWNLSKPRTMRNSTLPWGGRT
jgi:hypothetical protein